MRIVIKNSLKNLNIEALTPMQTQAIDAIYKNRNTFIIAPTGSGKTLAYLLPVTKIAASHNGKVQALIIVPSRELAQQIQDVHKSMGTGVRMMCCYGGHPIDVEKEEFLLEPSILVGTPGRIASHMEHDRFDYSQISMLVLDEFDKSLEFGFIDDMTAIVDKLTKLKKRICISATKLETIPDFVKMTDPCSVEFTDVLVQPRISMKIVESPVPDKLDTLLHLIKYIGNQPTLIFCNHRDAVERVMDFLYKKKCQVKMYHGGMEQDAREEALMKFRNGSFHLLVTTDLASRGIDIPEIQYIIHYHLPSTEASFIHRNGRTARMQSTGTTYIILSGDEQLPPYISEKPVVEKISTDLPFPDKTEWVTMELNVGKRDKISKGDIVGYLSQKGRLNKDELGLVEVTYRDSFAAVRRSKVKQVLSLVANEPLKRKLVSINVDG